MEALRQLAFDPGQIVAVARAVVLLAVGLLLARVISRVAARVSAARLEAQQTHLLRRFLSYGITALFAVAALHQLGFNLGVLLGAAGGAPRQAIRQCASRSAFTTVR